MMALVWLGLSIGILAGIWVWVSIALAVATWPAFVAWAAFFASGGDVKSLYKAALPVTSGVILGWIAVMLMPLLGGGTLGLAIAVVIVAFVMVVMAKIPGFEFVPGQFMGAAVFFGVGADNPAFLKALIPLLVGVVLGYVSAMLPKLVEKPQAQEPAKSKAT